MMRRLGVLLGVAAVCAVGSAAAAAGHSAAWRSTHAFSSSSIDRNSTCGEGGPFSYPWPIKPFDRPHPVRGNFGDPRTIFRASTVNSEEGAFSFHNGVDISAPPGTSVYPVVSGVAQVVPGGTVIVHTNDERSFQYHHIVPAVLSGARVVAQRTILGFVSAEAGHVHLTEVRDAIVQNPLAPGHLRPYRDVVPPTVESVAFSDEQGRSLSPLDLTGLVTITARAYDLPSTPVPGIWHGLPVTPAVMRWRIESIDGARLFPEETSADFRETVPNDDAFWSLYARGTLQNFPVIGSRYFFQLAGSYVFHLTLEPLDSTRLAPGSYRLVVTAADVCGNTGSLSVPIRVRPGEMSPAPPLLPVPLAAPGTVGRWRGWSPAYTVVLASVPIDEGRTAALARARSLGQSLGPVGLLESSRFTSLRPGYFVVFRGRYRSAGAATAAASGIPGAYIREVVRRGHPPRARRRRTPPGTWPRGRTGYTVVLASLPISGGARVALAAARRARRQGLPRVGVLVSGRFPSLARGYYVVFSGYYPAAGPALRAAARRPGAYARLVVPRG